MTTSHLNCQVLMKMKRMMEMWPMFRGGGGGGGGYTHTLPIRVCAAQRARDFKAPDLEQGIHFRGVF